MKLVLAVIHNDDTMVVTSELTRRNFYVTRLSTSGGFLMVGNTTLLIATEDERVDALKDVLKQFCTTRKHVNASLESFGKGLRNGSIAEEITEGGASIIVLNIENFEKI